MPNEQPGGPGLNLLQATQRLDHYLTSTAQLLLEHAGGVADRDAIAEAIDTVGRHLIWIGQRVPGFRTPEPVIHADPDLPVPPAADGPARWTVNALRSSCECLRAIASGLTAAEIDAAESDTGDDDGYNAPGMNRQTEEWILKEMAGARSRLDHLAALAAQAPFSDTAIAEVLGGS